MVVCFVERVALLALFGPAALADPPGSDAACRHIRRNGKCWPAADEAFKELCCSAAGALDSACWTWPHSVRRCCTVAVAASAAPSMATLPASCTVADLAILEDLPSLFRLGTLPRDVSVPRTPQALRALLNSSDLDDEVQRCAPAALSHVAVVAEFTAALGTRAALEAAQDAKLLLSCLLGWARINGWSPRSNFHFPQNIVYAGFMRLASAVELHRRPRLNAIGVVNVMGFDCDRKGQDDCGKCFSDWQNAQGCKEKFRYQRVLVNILSMLLAAPHARAVERRTGAIGVEVVVLARMFAALEYHGLHNADVTAFLGSAFSLITGRLKKGRKAYEPLLKGMHTIAAGIANNTEGCYAENSKEAMIVRVLDLAQCRTRSFVEIGVGWGEQCNTRFLRQHRGWSGLMFDQVGGNKAVGLHHQMVTAENINQLFRNLHVPHNLDLLSIDVDGNDFWLWYALTDYRPRVVIIEYSKVFALNDIVTRYSAESSLTFAMNDGSNVGILGSSLRALIALARTKRYRLVEVSDQDAFFVRADINVPELDVNTLSSDFLVDKTASSALVSRLLTVAGDFYLSSAEALSGAGAAAAINAGWVEGAAPSSCLENEFEALCASIAATHCY